MRGHKGFTLIELLIVVAIIAILAAIAIPNFLAAQTRSKVSRAKGEQNMLATGLEAYFIDANVYPQPNPSSTREGQSWDLDPGQTGAMTGSYAQDGGIIPIALTTPVAYITTTPKDPFKKNGRGYYEYGGGPGDTNQTGTNTGAYLSTGGAVHPVWPPAGWIVSSYGPDVADGIGGTADGNQLREESLWTDYPGYSPPIILQTEKYTYDPTNGTTSAGDVWRRGP